jgi:TolB-like protein
MSAPDVFLSYTREDQQAAQRFAEGFEAQGLSVWWDVTLRSGEAYDQVTEEALRTAKAVVVLWSKKSVVSRWVRAEATLADRNRTLVPARIEPCDLPIMFELTQTADLSRWNGEGSDPGWRAFIGDVRRFMAGRAEPAAPAPSSPAPRRTGRPTIAVLPFVNRSGVSEDDVFADGMVEDLTGALSLSRKMRVIAASATAAYRKGAVDLRQIGRDLGVRYLLEGNVRRVGDDLRVTAQLVEAEDGDILWTQKFDRPLAELAALQEALVTEVAGRLGVEVQRAEMELALRKPGDITAWEAVLRAEANLSRQSVAGAIAAAAEAERAVQIDPDYDLGYATLALAQGMVLGLSGAEGVEQRAQVVLGLSGRESAEQKAQVLSNVERARASDSNDPLVLARLSAALTFVGSDREALSFAERARRANPNLELPHIALGVVLLRLGRLEEAISEFDAAERIAPNGVWAHAPLFWRAVAHLRCGRPAQALELTDDVLWLRPFPPALIHRILCLAALDLWDEAREAMRNFRASHADMSFSKVENQVRGIVCMGVSPSAIDETVAIIRRLWDETSGESSSA